MRVTLMGRNQVHELNREHIAADVALLLSGLRTTLWERFRAEFRNWKVRPLFASVFGSMARGDGDAASDIDLLLVHPPLPGEKKPTRVSPSLQAQISDALAQFLVASSEADAAHQWEEQVGQLRHSVEAWTGNPLQVVDLSFHEWRRPADQHRRLLAEIERDGIDLVKGRAMALWSSGAAHG